MDALARPNLRLPGRILAAVVAVVVLLLAVAATAEGYFIEGRRWPGRTITYYASAYRKAADRGAKAWNDASVGVTLKRTTNKSKANFVISYSSDVKACEGVSIVGYQGRHVQTWTHLGRGCDRDFMVITATHEMGHILGLGHETHRCARMNPSADFPSGTPNHCHYHSRSYWFAHLLKGDDISGARALYGG